MAGSTRSIVVALCGATALAFAACGGGSSSDEDKIRDVVKDVDDNPSSLCTDHGTDQLVQKLGGEQRCTAAAQLAAKQDPSKTTVESVDVNGDKATAKLKDASGNSTVTFVKEDGDWKVSDSVSG
jgi:hypothetical protein